MTRSHDEPISRRHVLSAGAALGGAAVASTALPVVASAAETVPASPGKIRYCLNMSTVRGQKLSVPEQVDLAAKAGYDAIEPWMGDLGNIVARRRQPGRSQKADRRPRPGGGQRHRLCRVDRR